MDTVEEAIVDYYARRAAEYDGVYAKPERQAELKVIHQFLSSAFPGDNLLEVACGTGFWTRSIAISASSILATDCNPEVLDIARQRNYGDCRIEFAEADAYLLDGIPGNFTAGFHGFWWSHIPKSRIPEFLRTFHSRLLPGAGVVMIDNAFEEGSSTPISGRDREGNTYQTRCLQDGSEYEILKNYPTETLLRESLSWLALDVTIKFLRHYWIAKYRTR